MGNTSSANDTPEPKKNVLTLSTPLVQKDVECLLRQQGAVVESFQEDACVVTLYDYTVFVIRGAQPSRVACNHDCWCEDNCPFLSTVTIHGIVLREWCLPSQSKIVFLSETFLRESAVAAKQALVRYLAGKEEKIETTTANSLSSLQATWMPRVNNNDNNNKDNNTPFPLNTITSFQNDLFEGHCLMLIKPIPPQPAPLLFQNKKRRIVWQLQGKFRRPVCGVLYVGAELSQPMRLGLVTQGVARLLLQLVQRFQRNVHSSFGDGELAHIVIPAFTAMERILVTPPGGPLPVMGEYWNESPESMQLRKETQSTGTWNTTDTYSMEFFSMYVDLAQWKLVQLPVSGDIALQTFWGDSPLHICMYEAPPREKHVAANKQYAFGVQLKFLGVSSSSNKASDKEQVSSEEQASSEEEEEDNDVLRWSGSHRPLVQSSAVPTLSRRESGVFAIEDESTEQQEEEEDAYYYFDAEEMSNEETIVNIEQETGLLAQIDDACPCWLEVCTTSRGGYNKVFAVGENLWPASACESFVRNHKWIRKQMDTHFSPRISGSEWTRRALGLIIVFSKIELLDQLKGMKSIQTSSYEALFLKRANKLGNNNKERDEVIAEGFIARAISDRHWMEEWARVYSDRIEFFHPDKNKPHFQISSIIGAKPLSNEDCPNIPQFSFLAIDTPGRTVYLMFRQESQRDEWLLCIHSCSSDTVLSDMILDNPAEEFLHKSTMWRCKNRRVLNCARFSFHSRLVAKEDPLELVTRALRLALDGNATRAFLEVAASLKDTVTDNLSEDKKLAFFLNLYHVMISHAFLVLGPPNWSLVWINYFNNVAYQAGDDIFSLTELEHCIIRAKMSAPSQFLSRFAIPKSNYSRMALATKDCRINFALNCGSLSNPESIFIYSEKNLDDQLSSASRLYLQSVTATPKNKDLIIQLPRICQWYRDDFGDSDDELLRSIRDFLPDSVRQATKTTSAELIVRFSPYQFECRQFVSILMDHDHE